MPSLYYTAVIVSCKRTAIPISYSQYQKGCVYSTAFISATFIIKHPPDSVRKTFSHSCADNTLKLLDEL